MIWHKFDPEDKETWPPVSTDILVVRKIMGGRVIRRGYHSAINHKYFCVEGNLIDVKMITHWAHMPELPLEGYENESELIDWIYKAASALSSGYVNEEFDLYCSEELYPRLMQLLKYLPRKIKNVFNVSPYIEEKLPQGTVMLAKHTDPAEHFTNGEHSHV